MSSQVYRIDVPAPFSAERTQSRLGIAIEAGMKWLFAATAEYRRRHAAQRLQRQVARDVARARREAYAMMRDDPRMASDLLAAADRYEGSALPPGTSDR